MAICVFLLLLARDYDSLLLWVVIFKPTQDVQSPYFLIFFCQKLCPGTDLCIASLSEVKTIRTLSGVRDVTSAVNCTCIPRERDCQRMSSEQVFFKGTKFETIIDVGQCKGKCRSRGKWKRGLRLYEYAVFLMRCGL